MAARLLLVVMAALGVLVMHTVGHPADSGPETTVTAHAADTRATGEPGAATGMSMPRALGDPGHDSASADVAVPPHEPGMAMNMASLCLAVLGTWGLFSLLRAALASRREWLAHLMGRVLMALRPNAPPPRPPDLAHLSVLRI
ncbi:DUF6153 family protein [Streptomyces sp. NPDC000941]